MKIFIGCSSKHIGGNINEPETNSLAVKIYDSLMEKYDPTEKNNIVFPWWKDNTIRPGDYFFKRLLELSSICDYGIFILSKESEEKVSNSSDSKNYTHLSNDNVYIELGMFMAQNGIERTIFILEKDVKRPSDFSGINIIRHDFEDESSVDKILNEVQERIIKNESIRKNYVNFKMYINKRTSDKILENSPIIQSWKSKSAYIGLDAAKIWSSIETDPNYMSGDFKSQFRKYIHRKVQKEVGNIDNIVSLGSGIGTMDQMIVRNISNKGIKYIPIELNPYLAYKALDNVLNSTINNHTSFAIIDDFEDEISQLNDFITNTLVSKEEESLYIMLGGTFSNIDSPDTFLNEFSKLVDSNDYFLIDASVFGENYCIDKDKENRLQNIFAKKLCISSIKHKYESGDIFTNSKKVIKFLNFGKDKQIKELFNYVNIEPIGDIDNDDNLLFLYKFIFEDSSLTKSDASILFKIKRYNYTKLHKKLARFFDIVKIDQEEGTKIILSDEISMVYFLLKKKKKKTK